MDIPAYGESNLAKNSLWSFAESERERERKFWKRFEKVVWTSQIWFFKNQIHEFRLIEKQFRLIEIDRGFSKILKQFQNNFDWSKNRLYQSKQTEASLNNFKKNFDWSKNRLDQSKLAEAHKIWGKKKKHSFWKKI